MAKTQEELKQLKVEYETLTNKLKELSNDELEKVTGGVNIVMDLNLYFSTHPDLYNTYSKYRYVVGTRAPYAGKWGMVDHYAPMIASTMALYVQLLGERELRLFYPYEVADYTPSLSELYEYIQFHQAL